MSGTNGLGHLRRFARPRPVSVNRRATSLAALYDDSNFLLHTRHGELDVFSVDETPGAPRDYQQLRAQAIAVDVRNLRLFTDASARLNG